MSVSATIGVERLPWQGFQELALPIGVWASQQQVLGDATGGGAAIQMILVESGGSPGAQLFNLEQVAAFHNGAAAAVVTIATNGMQSFRGFAMTQRFSMNIPAPGTGANNGISGADLAFLPVWLGAQVNAGTDADLVWSTPNVDTVTVAVRAFGYIWAASALQAPGGPRRPLGGAFG